MVVMVVLLKTPSSLAIPSFALVALIPWLSLFYNYFCSLAGLVFSCSLSTVAHLHLRV
jgi:hypothetical protein